MASKGYISSIPGGDSFLGDQGPTEGVLLTTVLPYVIMIVLFPIGSFFFSKTFIFQDILNYNDTTANVYSAICAVIILHILLALFIIRSFRDSSPKGAKQD